ncbi:hypothetical protein Tco_1174333 [Tanacetum coccineum]
MLSSLNCRTKQLNLKRISKNLKIQKLFYKKINHLRTQLENLKGKSVETKFDKPSILEKPPADRLLITSQLLKSWFTPKVVVQKDLSKPVTTQSLSKNEKDQLLSRIASLKSKLASQDLRSCQKEYHDLRTSYNALKIKFDSINRTKRKTKVSNSLKSKVNMDNPNITMKEYISLEEEKARRRGKVYNWETATYGKIRYDEDIQDFRSVETEFSAIVFNDSLTFEETPSCEPTVSSLNDNEIDFRISFDESDDKYYTPTVSYFDDLDFFKDFENEFPAIVYNDALASKSDFSTEPVVIPQHIDEFNLKDETS